MKPEKFMSQYPASLTTLLHKANIKCGGIRCVDPVNSGVTNRNSLITLQSGSRYILREYDWPYPTSDNLHRFEKELYLHDLLLKYDVPVPSIVANYDDGSNCAVLMEYMPGQLLGNVVDTLTEVQRAQAWRAAGTALRKVHSIRLPDGCSGVIVGERVQPFEEGSWGDFHFHQAIQHANHLLKRDLGLRFDLASMKSVLKQAVPLLNESPVVLLHNDPHPWNVLVHEAAGRWTCSAWLDWEYAWSGDPVWDLVRTDLFRLKRIGPAPDAFYEGYGAFPREPNRSIYELSIYLWMANQYLDGEVDGERVLMPTYEAAMRYLEQIDESVARIGIEIERAERLP